MAPFPLPHGKLPKSPRQRLWRILRWCHTPRSLADLYATTEIEPEQLFALLEEFETRGFMQAEPGPLRFMMVDAARDRKVAPAALTQRSAKRTKPAAPVEPDRPIKRWQSIPRASSRKRMWSAMRVLREFDVPTLCMTAEASEKSVKEYLNCLRRAGYVADLRKDDEPPVYRLVRNTGPYHPLTRRFAEDQASIVEVEDHNTGETHRHSRPVRRWWAKDAPPGEASEASDDDRGGVS